MSPRPEKQLARMLAAFRRRLERETGIPPAEGFWNQLRFWECKHRQEMRNEFNARMRARYVANQTHKIIFCPIEKNASSSFKRILIEHSEYRTEWQESETKLVHSFLRPRKKLRLANRKQIRDSSFLRFVIVREPIERIVSAYLDKFVQNEDVVVAHLAAYQYAAMGRDDAEPKRLLTFRQFVELLAARDDPHLDSHWRSQISFLSQVIECFDWIVPLNRIGDFTPVLEQRIGAELPRRKSRNKPRQRPFGVELGMFDWYPDQLRQLSPREGYLDLGSLVSAELGDALKQRFQIDGELYQLACKHFELKLGNGPN